MLTPELTFRVKILKAIASSQRFNMLTQDKIDECFVFDTLEFKPSYDSGSI
ncbi:MAG: hypothetical protein V7K77_22240 [Nostoc sp.]|uniref:hypothetical protein n=1 Tax=Nostoc sp. TaxID=1180 RepID=UPI002FF69B8C